MNNENVNEEDSNALTEVSESSGSQNEANEQQITLFKSFSRIVQTITYSFAYFTVSSFILNKIANRFFSEYGIVFKWNIYELIKK